MYLNYPVKIPDSTAGITRKAIKGSTYIYYAYGRVYDPEKKYTVPKSTTIGKQAEDPDMMYPNTNFLKYFPEVELPDVKPASSRSGCLRIGSFLVIRQIIAGYHIDEMIDRLMGRDAGLFLDLAAYSIITENNAAQYYPDYAYNHPLFTSGMRVYSDSKVSDFLSSISRDQAISFQTGWNYKRDKKQHIYVSYDSTNKNCQAGDLELVEIGHAKDDQGKPILNFSVAYDSNNREPLFYEEYPGSIVDVSQLQYMLEKAEGYGYKDVAFILDRGYFSKGNIHFMDKHGFDFVIMVKGMKALVNDLVMEVRGSFEDKRQYSIRDYKVSGITVKRQLYPSDEKERYFHIFYNSRKQASEREVFESRVDRMALALENQKGRNITIDNSFRKYFDLVYYHEGKKDQKFMYGIEKEDAINRGIQLCGYFVIITSEKMTAAEALDLYKSRDASEKLFRGDKSYLGNKSFRVQSDESLHAKIFIEFVALIIRNKIYTSLKERMAQTGKKLNYMTVPAALRELEKIEMIRQSDDSYLLDHALTAAQKEILQAFSINTRSVREQAAGINQDLKRLQEQ